MKIAVNTRLLLKDKLEGIGWFTYETLKRIVTQHPEHEFVFIFDRDYDHEYIFAENVKPVVLKPVTRHPVLWYWWFEKKIPQLLKDENIDLFLSPDGYLSLKTDVPSIPVIHDINFVHYPKDLPFLTGKYYNYFFKKFAQKADRIVTVSNYSKRDMVSNFAIDSEKVDVVYNGASDIFKPISVDEQQKVKEKYTNGADYFIFVGALLPRKNVARLLKAFDAFKKAHDSDIKLVIVGAKMFKTKSIENIYKKMQFRDDVIFTGRLPGSELTRLLASALALTFVPIFEGFGIPIVEAMYCDTPVITSNVTSMPEIAGGAALFVNPFSPDSIKGAMLKMVKDTKYREHLIRIARNHRENFDWQKTADELWNVIEKVAEK